MNRVEVIRVRLTTEERERVQQLADRNHRSISNQIRCAVLDQLARSDGQDVMAGLERTLPETSEAAEAAERRMFTKNGIAS